MSENFKRRGFASMTPEKRKEIAGMGGRAAHASGRAHQFTSAEARAAGQKGGMTTSSDRAHMAAIGREGGKRRGMRGTEICDDAPQSVELAGSAAEL
jgi:general stress protein YciG